MTKIMIIDLDTEADQDAQISQISPDDVTLIRVTRIALSWFCWFLFPVGTQYISFSPHKCRHIVVLAVVGYFWETVSSEYISLTPTLTCSLHLFCLFSFSLLRTTITLNPSYLPIRAKTPNLATTSEKGASICSTFFVGVTGV